MYQHYFLSFAMSKKHSIVEYPDMCIKELLTEAQQDRLFRPTPEAAIYIHTEKKSRKHPNGVPYVSASYITRELNIIFGHNWEHVVIQDLSDEDEIVLQTMLIVNIVDKESSAVHQIKRTQFGGSKIKRYKSNGKVISRADTYKSAQSDALKKCASWLGIASDIYGEDEYVVIQNKPVSDSSDNMKKEIERLKKYIFEAKGISALKKVNARVYELDNQLLINLFENKVKSYEEKK